MASITPRPRVTRGKSPGGTQPQPPLAAACPDLLHPGDDPVSVPHRILANTAALYTRTALTALLALFTSRVLLRALGPENFGLISLLTGLVGLLGFVTSALATGTQRQFALELAAGNPLRLQQAFNLSLAVHAAWALVLLLLAETLGLYLLQNVLQFPDAQRPAALWVYQSAVAAALAHTVAVPASALLVAHEKLTWTAAFDTLRALLVLFAALGAAHPSVDRLMIFAFAIAAIAIFMTTSQFLLCRYAFGPITQLRLVLLRDTHGLRPLAHIAGCTLYGAGTLIARLHGTGLLLNAFFGVTVNAAYGLSLQLQSQLSQLTQPLVHAGTPRILLLAGGNRLSHATQLTLRLCKYGGFLAGLAIIPLLPELPTLLTLWLRDPPPHTVDFCRWLLLGFFIDQLSFPLGNLATAVGRLAAYQLIVGSVHLLGLPLAYVLLRAGHSPGFAMAASVAALAAAAILRPVVIGRVAGFTWLQWFREVCFPLILALVPALLVTVLGTCLLPPNTLRGLVLIPAAVLVGCTGLYAWGMSRAERRTWRQFVQNPQLAIPDLT